MAPQLTNAQAKAMLTKLGFDNANKKFTVAVNGFQRGWNLGPALKVDSKFGPKTSDALRISYARFKAHKSDMSAHFSYREFRCKDGAVFESCRRIWILRSHVRRLEKYRASIGGKSIRIVSGCRCKQYNKKVGGVSSSQHLFGAATDIDGRLTLDQKENLGLFAGMGFKQSTGKVIHVDSRDRGGHNPKGSTPTKPAEWKYAT
ncbi:D-Ala-D-Ala carboxypeptidase family metallohydrolase [Angustibacter sp. McL0619]|uniref:D-Ala-D-Ala carboxypeptidase family metallohydrolase n=1 Tax=Angustibacter sp. McL0619 TaxID=3415676 RepID=UPI003CF4E853